MELAIDPVCDMEFDQRAAAALSAYQNRVYYFCHPVCKKIFDADPARFVEAKGPEATSATIHESVEDREQTNLTPDCEWISAARSEGR